MSRGLKGFLFFSCEERAEALLFCRDVVRLPLLLDEAARGGTGLTLRLRVLLRLPAMVVM